MTQGRRRWGLSHESVVCVGPKPQSREPPLGFGNSDVSDSMLASEQGGVGSFTANLTGRYGDEGGITSKTLLVPMVEPD